MKNLKCYIYYLLIILVDAFNKPNPFTKIPPSQKIVNRAWKHKDERFLWQTLSKVLQDIWKVMLFWIVFIYVTVFRSGSDFFSIVMRIVGWSVLSLILVAPPLILLVQECANARMRECTNYLSLKTDRIDEQENFYLLSP